MIIVCSGHIQRCFHGSKAGPRMIEQAALSSIDRILQ